MHQVEEDDEILVGLTNHSAPPIQAPVVSDHTYPNPKAVVLLELETSFEILKSCVWL